MTCHHMYWNTLLNVSSITVLELLPPCAFHSQWLHRTTQCDSRCQFAIQLLAGCLAQREDCKEVSGVLNIEREESNEESHLRHRGREEISSIPRTRWGRPGRGAVASNRRRCALGCSATGEREREKGDDGRLYAGEIAKMKLCKGDGSDTQWVLLTFTDRIRSCARHKRSQHR